MIKTIGIIIILLSTIVIGCVESQPSAPTAIETPKAAVGSTVSTPMATQSTPIPTQTPNQKIIINYSAKKANTIGMYSEAPQGKVYLIVTMTIENHGYKEFNTNPYTFKLIANNIKYDIAAESYSLKDKLDTVDLLDGGSLKGSLAFEVPSDIGNYQIQIESWREYNINYITN